MEWLPWFLIFSSALLFRASADAVRPLGAPSPKKADTLFTLLDPAESGVRMVHKLDLKHPLKRLYYNHAAGGIAIGDFNGDALPDLFFVSGPDSNRLYLRLPGELKFRDATEEAGVGGGDRWGAGVAAVDIEGDGDLDLYVANYDQPNQLFVNQGVGKEGRLRFVEQAKDFGLDISDASLMPSFCDYDRDGDLDVYVQTYAFYREGGRPNFQIPTLQENGQTVLAPEWRKYYRLRPSADGPPILEEAGRADLLLRNDSKDGRPVFREVTAQAGLPAAQERGYASIWWDYNGDGWMDLYVANDLDEPDHLYRNLGNGGFSEVSKDALPHTSWSSMGCASADLNNDGLLDLFVVDMAASQHFWQKVSMGQMNEAAIRAVAGPPPQIMRNALFVNTGTGRFLEGAYLAGLAETNWSWAAKFADFDCDGWVDLFVTNGVVRNILNSDRPSLKGAKLFGKTDWDQVENESERREQNLAYRNRGRLEFEDSSKAWGLDHVGMSYGAAAGDLDGDGDMDLVVANVEEPLSIYLNQSQAKGRANIRLRGRAPNTRAIGARLTVSYGSLRQVQQLMPTMGFFSSDEALAQVGVGEAKTFDLTIRWPRGSEQHFTGLAVGQEYLFDEAEDAPPIKSPVPPAPRFLESKAFAGSGGIERAFDDFAIQPLLPNKLSNLGPGLACGDVDGDGDDDLWFSRPAGVRGVLFPNTTTPGQPFSVSAALSPSFDADAECEDMAPLFFDADGDGDQDIYVASGSVEWKPGSEPYRDRLYLNQTPPGASQLSFVAAPADSLPKIRDSSGAVAAADFDRDGDLDLFVGSRVIPGQYPLPASSRLLLNEGKARFREVTKEAAPELLESGLATSALWSDADDDGWLDLLVTYEWGPVKLFRNEAGKLKDVTKEAGLDRWRGWWNGIAARDVDNDGDMDFAVTNFGLNTKYHASAEHPAVIYYGDVDGSGQANIIEAEHEGNRIFPVRGRSCSTRAMPSLASKFTTFRDFAKSTLEEVYTPERLRTAKRFEANTLESGLLRNLGKGKFAFEPFPREAQIAPGFGVVLTELDGDGWADCVIAQNFHSPQLETGRMDGGLSLWMRGSPAGFQPVPAAESGLVVPGDAKGLAVSDFSRDGWPDLLFALNNNDPRFFLGQASESGRILWVALKGKAGNPTAVGARLTLLLSDGSRQVAEVQAGGGYMSQNSALQAFGLPNNRTSRELIVRWPRGTVTKHKPPKEVGGKVPWAIQE